MLLAVAAAGVTGWLVAEDPLVATVCVVVADLIALAMMVPKTWRDPRSETLSTFALASVGGALPRSSVGALEPSLLLYPAYYCLANGALALMILGRRAAYSVAPGGGATSACSRSRYAECSSSGFSRSSLAVPR